MPTTSLADYRTLGRSGLRVSPLCLGTMTFGQEWGWGADAAASDAMLDRYLGAGGNFLDTANIYTKGHSEVIIGDYLKQRGGRHRVVLATKFCGNLHAGDPNAGGASRKSITFNLDESLRRLRSDYIDLYWMHFSDPHTPIAETMRALDDAVCAGKVRYLGISDTPAWRAVQGQYEAIFRNWTPFIALQIEYSLMERSVEGDLLPMAQELGLGITPWSPLKGGLLSGKYGRHRHPEGEGRHKPDSKYLTERTYQILDALDAVAKEQGQDAAAVALAPGQLARVLVVMTVASATAGLLFNLTTNGNGRLLAERLRGVVDDPATLGLLLAAVYALASLSQVVVGRLLDRVPLKRLQLGIVLLQAPLLATASLAQGWALYAALLGVMVLIFGAIPFTDAVIVRYVDDHMRSRVAGLRLTISLGFSSMAVWALGPVVKASSFATLLMVMAGISLCTAAALLAMPGEPARAAA